MSELTIHFGLDLIKFHPHDGIEFVLLPIHIRTKLSSDPRVVEFSCLALFESFFYLLVELLYVLVQTLCVCLHLFYYELEFFVLENVLVQFTC